MEENKLHYFSFCFESFNGYTTSKSSAYVGYPENLVTLPRIDMAKEYCSMPEDCVLLSVSYLGHMTPSQFKGEA